MFRWSTMFRPFPDLRKTAVAMIDPRPGDAILFVWRGDPRARRGMRRRRRPERPHRVVWTRTRRAQAAWKPPPSTQEPSSSSRRRRRPLFRSTPARSPWSWCRTWPTGRTRRTPGAIRRSIQGRRARRAHRDARDAEARPGDRRAPQAPAPARDQVLHLFTRGRRRGRARAGQHGRRRVLRGKKAPKGLDVEVRGPSDLWTFGPLDLSEARQVSSAVNR